MLKNKNPYDILLNKMLNFKFWKEQKKMENEKELENLEMENELDNLVILNDEEGQEVKFEFLDLIEFESESYIVLLPLEEDEEDSGEVVILQVEDVDTEEESYVSVEDQEVLQKVFEMFKDKFKDEFNFIDEE